MIRIYRADGTHYTPSMPATARPPHAPFNTVAGERVEGLGDDYVVVPASRWMDTPVIEMAFDRAKEALKKHRLAPMQAELLVQEYHSRDILLVLIAVWGKAPGKAAWQWHYVPVPFDITGETKVSLVLAGRWKSGTRH